MRASRFALGLAVVALLAGCANSRRPPRDGGSFDFGGGDASLPDGSPADLGGGDGGGVDGGGRDGGGMDAGHDAGATDAGRDAGAFDAGRDAGAFDAGRDLGPPTGGTVSFPTSTDTSHSLTGTNYWNLGDYVEGTRSTSLGSATHLTLNVGVAMNSLSGDTQDMKVMLNGTMVGSFMIHGGDTRLTNAYTFPAVAGPSYTIRFECTRTVTSGAGSAGFDLTTSSVTLAP